MSLPRVAVLLATHNGAKWLEEQIDSIFSQAEVETTVFASDDRSSDETLKLLDRYARNKALEVLPESMEGFGNANRNFMRLIADVEAAEFDYVALSDQDDIWLPEKLARAVSILKSKGVDAYSGDVTAFWPDGREMLIEKSRPQRRYDYLFESAGPGCTFVFTRAAYAQLHRFIQANRDQVAEAKVHDWLIYAYARVNAWKWHIDSVPLMRYRQHSANEVGVNSGTSAIKRRFAAIRSGAYRRDVLCIAQLASDRSWITEALTRFRIGDRLRLLKGVSECRRQPRERLWLGLFFLLMPRS